MKGKPLPNKTEGSKGGRWFPFSDETAQERDGAGPSDVAPTANAVVPTKTVDATPAPAAPSRPSSSFPPAPSSPPATWESGADKPSASYVAALAPKAERLASPVAAAPVADAPAGFDRPLPRPQAPLGSSVPPAAAGPGAGLPKSEAEGRAAASSVATSAPRFLSHPPPLQRSVETKPADAVRAEPAKPSFDVGAAREPRLPRHSLPEDSRAESAFGHGAAEPIGVRGNAPAPHGLAAAEEPFGSVMPGRSAPGAVTRATAGKQTVIEEGTVLTGTLTATCPVVISGTFEGRVESPETTVTATGTVVGTLKARRVVSSGQVAGRVEADDALITGVVRSGTTIRARRLELKVGSESSFLEMTCSCPASLASGGAQEEPANESHPND